MTVCAAMQKKCTIALAIIIVSVLALVPIISIALFGDLITTDHHIKSTIDFKYSLDYSGCS